MKFEGDFLQWAHCWQHETVIMFDRTGLETEAGHLSSFAECIDFDGFKPAAELEFG